MRHLPKESATVKAMSEGRAAWTQENELLASIYDSLRWQLWQGGGKASAPKPKPFPRPGRPDRHRTTLTPEQIRARLLAQRARHARRG